MNAFIALLHLQNENQPPQDEPERPLLTRTLVAPWPNLEATHTPLLILPKQKLVWSHLLATQVLNFKKHFLVFLQSYLFVHLSPVSPETCSHLWQQLSLCQVVVLLGAQRITEYTQMPLSYLKGAFSFQICKFLTKRQTYFNRKSCINKKSYV